MTLRSGDTIYPHHPTEVATWDGDLPVNNRPGDVWYLLVDEDTYETAWDILNELLKGTSWHIHPALVDYIANYILKAYIETSFDADIVSTNFTVCPVKTSYQVASVTSDNVGVKELTGMTAFTVLPVQTAFTLKRDIVINFKITRVIDNTRQP